MSGPVGELPGSPPREVQAEPPTAEQMAALASNNMVTITANEYYDLLHEIERLHAEVEELKVQDIVSRNPGINVEDVRRFRATGVMPAPHSSDGDRTPNEEGGSVGT